MEFDVTIEIPKGQRNKYEMDHHTGRIRLDRRLFTSTSYPADYGFVENTLGGLSYGTFLANAASVFILFLGIVAALNQVGVATTVTLGTVAWPMMKRVGYRPDDAGGLLAAAWAAVACARRRKRSFMQPDPAESEGFEPPRGLRP